MFRITRLTFIKNKEVQFIGQTLRLIQFISLRIYYHYELTQIFTWILRASWFQPDGAW